MTDAALSRAEESLEAVNTASGISRTLYTALMTLSGYLVVVMATTDDLQLLLYSPLTLPILNIEIDLRGFFIWMPWLYLIVHAYTLLNFSLLTDKLDHFNACCRSLAYPQRQHLRKRLHVLAFTQFSAGRHKGLFGSILSFLTWFTITLFPIGILLFMQLDFLPAQDEGVVYWQRWAIVVDVLVSVYFWNIILQKRRRAMLPKGWKPPIWRRRSFTGHVLVLIGFLVIYFSVFVAVIPLSAWEREIRNGFVGAKQISFEDTYKKEIAFELIRFGEEAVYEEWQKQITDALNEYKTKDKAQDPCTNWVYDWLPLHWLRPSCHTRWVFDPSRSMVGPRRNLIVTGEVITRNPLSPEVLHRIKKPPVSFNEGFGDEFPHLKRLFSEAREYDFAQLFPKIVGWEFHRGRSFRFAELTGSVLPRVKLTGAQLQGANLWNVHLQGASLQYAELQEASLGYAQLQEADLSGANLKDASLRDANLKGANIERGDIQGADIKHAELPEVNLSYANLQGAYLKYANLRDANLQFANLIGADLSNSLLQRAIFFNSELVGTDLSSAELQGVDFRLSPLQGSNLKNVDLRGANLSWANLQGASLSGALLHGADLSSADLQGADLTNAYLQGSYLEKTSINNTNMRDADLRLSLVHFVIDPLRAEVSENILNKLNALNKEMKPWRQFDLHTITDRLNRATSANKPSNNVVDQSFMENCITIQTDNQREMKVLGNFCESLSGQPFNEDESKLQIETWAKAWAKLMREQVCGSESGNHISRRLLKGTIFVNRLTEPTLNLKDIESSSVLSAARDYAIQIFSLHPPWYEIESCVGREAVEKDEMLKPWLDWLKANGRLFSP